MSTMTATTPRTSSAAHRSRTDWSVWTCPNCRHVTHEPRKRCRDCGTSRY
jgi:uncharacterized OB-fold protein